MKKFAALLLSLFAAFNSDGQAIVNRSPLHIIYQCRPYWWGGYDMCLYEFKNISSDTVSADMLSFLQMMGASSSGVLPGDDFEIEWNLQWPIKKLKDQISVPFNSKGRRFNITLSRTIDTSSKPLLLAMDSFVFDRGHVPYARQSDYTINWKVKNISAMEVLCPIEIDVWGDCDIIDRYKKEVPLLPGKTRDIKLRVHFSPTGFSKQRKGHIKAMGDKGGKRFVQDMYVSVKACFDPPLASDSLRMK